MNKNCYCNSEKSYKECCEPFIEGKQIPEHPEQLMRSRYTAYAVKNISYVLETTDVQTIHKVDRKSIEEWAQQSEFFLLEILNSSMEGNKGIVEFKAHYRVGNNDPEIHHEISKFRKHGGRWFYRDGRVPQKNSGE